MRRITWRALLAILFLFPLLPLIVQADEACSTADTRAEIQKQLDLLEENPLRAFVAILNLALAGFHDCSDDSYDFSGEQGAQPVLGPIALSPGHYIIAMTTYGSGKVVGTALEGCGKDVNGTLHSFSESQAVRGAEHLFAVVEECTLYLELSKITAPWTLAIDKIR